MNITYRNKHSVWVHEGTKKTSISLKDMYRKILPWHWYHVFRVKMPTGTVWAFDSLVDAANLKDQFPEALGFDRELSILTNKKNKIVPFSIEAKCRF